MSYHSTNKRYFDNPFVKDARVGAAYASSEWLFSAIERLIDAVTNRKFDKEEIEEVGPYVSANGICFSLAKTANSLSTLKDECIAHAEKILAKQEDIKTSRRTETQFLTGLLGYYVIQCITQHLNGKTPSALLCRITNMKDEVVKDIQGHGDDELFVGRAGYLSAILTLREYLHTEIMPNSKLRPVIEAILVSGRRYAKHRRFSAPLLYQYHGTEYLGAAHGLAGILQMLLNFSSVLTEDELAEVKATVDFMLTIRSSTGNFAPDLESVGGGENELVHWCHGAPGVLSMLISAYLIFQNSHYLEAARRCADLIWQKGVLKKGPGICHGVAGNGYAFLQMYRLTSEEEYLNRAKAFAVIMMDPQFQKEARTPDFPFSLFEGLAGSLCFLVDLLNPTQSQFPLFPIPF